MKNLYIYLFFLLLATSGFSQNYHPLIKPNKYWDVMVHDNSICGYASGARYFFDGSDTVINNQTYQIIKAYPIISLNQGPYCPPFAVDTNVIGSNDYWFIREDTSAKKVYVLEVQNNNTEDLLYDFNLVPGDTLQSLYAGLGTIHVVDSVGLITLENGDIRNIYYIDFLTYYIEGVGGTGGLYFPMFNGSPIEAMCVFEDNVVLWKGIWGSPCLDIMNTVDEEFIQSNIIVFPNPSSSGIFSIDVKKMGNIEVSVFNLLGELIYSNQENQSSQIKIDLSKETPGFYFCKIKSGNEFYTSKIIKH